MQSTSHKTHEKGFATGLLTFRNFVIESARAIEIDRFLKDHARAGLISPQYYLALVKELQEICKVREFKTHNLVVLTGRSAIAGGLGNEGSTAITFGALGDDDTAANAADTDLGNEVARKGVARRARTNNVLTLDFFYSQLDTDGTYEEFGAFIGGTLAADSGTLFNRSLTGGWTKTNNEAMTVSLEITINQG